MTRATTALSEPNGGGPQETSPAAGASASLAAGTQLDDPAQPVGIAPGSIAVTRIPSGSTSCARTSVNPLTTHWAGPPPALFTVGDLDPLRDDSIFMAARWQLAGGTAELDVWPEGAHAFTNMATPLGAIAQQRAIAWTTSVLNRVAPMTAG